MASLPQSASRSKPAWRIKLEGLWRWWTGQLALLVPERFAAMGGATRVPLLTMDEAAVQMVEPPIANARVALDQEAGRARSALHALLQRAGEGRDRVRVALSMGEALVRRAAMPAATEENLTQVLAFEMDRLTPFRADEVYFDHRVVSRDAAAGTIAILVAVARREIVDKRVQALRSLGATVEGVTVREDTGSPPLNLMPPELRGDKETAGERLAKRVLWGVVVALLVGVLVYPSWAKREEIKELHPIEAKAQADAQALDRLSQELDRLVAEHNFLLVKKHSTPPMLAYMEEVARLLPDNTWVQQFDLKTAGKIRELQIQGETTSSSKLIEIMEKSTLLTNASTRGTVTRGMLPGTERFSIAAEARPRPLPESIPLAQVATPVAPQRVPTPTGPGASPAPATPVPGAAGQPVTSPPAPATVPSKADPSKVPAKVEAVKPPADPKAPAKAPGK